MSFSKEGHRSNISSKILGFCFKNMFLATSRSYCKLVFFQLPSMAEEEDLLFAAAVFIGISNGKKIKNEK